MKPLFLICLALAAGTLAARAAPQIINFAPEDLIAAEVITAPFVVKQRYKSMEGPTQMVTITPQGLAVRQEPLKLMLEASEENRNISYGLIAPATKTRHLMWFLGAKIEVLDEVEDRVISPEYMCHLNLDTNLNIRRDSFPMSPGTNTRLLTLTGGAMDFFFPPGYGLPVASDEEHDVTFQVLNHNRDEPISVRHRLTLYYVADHQLQSPMQPLIYDVPFVAVPVDEGGKADERFKVSRCSCCTPLKYGAEADNAIGGLFDGPEGKKYSGHWSVPPGPSEFRFPLRYYARSFGSYETTAHAMIPHIHPYCTEMTVIEHDPTCSTSRVIYRSQVKNKEHETGLLDIDRFSSAQGLEIHPDRQYELAVHYDNSSGIAQDSMATMAIYTHDKRFIKPHWTQNEIEDIKLNGLINLPFDPRENVKVFLDTNLGGIEVELNAIDYPDIVFPFLQRLDYGSFDGLSFYRVQAGTYAQTHHITRERPKLQPYTGPIPEEKSFARWAQGQGTILMPQSAGPSQGNSSFLLSLQPMVADAGYVVFGRITKGKAVLDRLSRVPASEDLTPEQRIEIRTAYRVVPIEDELAKTAQDDPAALLQMLAAGRIAPTSPPPPSRPAGMFGLPTVSDTFESCGVAPRFDAFVPCSLAETAQGNHLLIKTSYGNMMCELYPEAAPEHVAQIKKLVANRCYDGSTIVRIDKDFVAQIEDLDYKRTGPLSPTQKALISPLPLEVFPNLNHQRGTLSMARSDDPGSAKTSFSFLLNAAPHLDQQYTVFGKVIEGLAVLDEIEARATSDAYAPSEWIQLESVQIVRPTDEALSAATATEKQEVAP